MPLLPETRLGPYQIRSLPGFRTHGRIEPEITAKLFKRGARVYEVPITCESRDYSKGKKITCATASALWTLINYRFVG